MKLIKNFDESLIKEEIKLTREFLELRDIYTDSKDVTDEKYLNEQIENIRRVFDKVFEIRLKLGIYDLNKYKKEGNKYKLGIIDGIIEYIEKVRKGQIQQEDIENIIKSIA